MTKLHSEGDPRSKEYWENRNHQMQYLDSKLTWLVEELEDEKKNFPDFVKSWLQDQGIDEDLKHMHKPNMKNGASIDAEVTIGSVKHKFSYLLETYMIERKRQVEHCIKMIRDSVSENKIDESLELGKFINSIEEVRERSIDEDSWQHKILFSDPSFFYHIEKQKEFLKHVRHQRNALAHQQAEVDKEIKLIFDYAEKRRNEIVRKRGDNIREYNVKLGDMTLEEFLEKDEENFDKFLKRCNVCINRIANSGNISGILSETKNGFIDWRNVEYLKEEN